MKTYLEVPVKEAKRISDEFDKDVVVILTYNVEHNLFHTTTFGRESDQNKLWAADLGDMMTLQAGADMTQKDVYADFRDPKSVLSEFDEWLQVKIADEDIPAERVVLKLPYFMNLFIKEKG